ncbi:MAG TPA: class I tRNA ligase family protein, partial [Thermoanaerobaculia bacterium]|nr:class I tRNA ligase family protein [Thermoanaerobaculia bacterium]
EIRERVKWVPPFGVNRIGAMVENRLEWTISRQRRWGSPITFLRCKPCREGGLVEHYPPAGDTAAHTAFFSNLVGIFRKSGADAWYDDAAFPVAAFVPEGARCARCGGADFEKVRDILDVWFDSGVSHAAVLRSGEYGIEDPYAPASKAPVLYLEGHDQHRGWFQSSLLTSVALTGAAPYDAVLTHGFVVDGEGRKMSKSVGNVVSPQDVIAKDGADVLRLFVAHSDFTDDVRLNKEILARTAEAYRKIRNTARFLLSVLFDFDSRTDVVPDASLTPLDAFVLSRASHLVKECHAAYERYEYHTVARRLLEFTTNDLSAFWCDVRKDALYVLAANHPVRRSAQTAALRIVETLALLLQPICPYTAEEIWENVPGRAGTSPAVETYETLRLAPLSREADLAWEKVLLLREEVQRRLEPLRRGGSVGSSAQAAVVVGEASALSEALQHAGLDFPALAEVLNVPEVIEGEGGAYFEPLNVALDVRAAEGTKCPRCWQVRRDGDADGLCGRCRDVLAVA